MKTLEKYYGRSLAYVITELKNGKININEQIKAVYDPRDFSRRIAPCAGCDLVIGDNSANSKDIFDIGGVSGNIMCFSYGRFDAITLFNYCELDQVNQVKTAHIDAIKNALNEFVINEQNRIEKTNEILKSL